jgi:transposase
MGLFAKASVAIDGSKFKAVNNRGRNFTRTKMQRRMAQIEESVARYLHQLDSADRQEPSLARTTKTTRFKEKIAILKEEMQRLEVLDMQMRATQDQQISLTDPDARSMATSGRGSGVVGYNVQVAVDTKRHLIVTHEVINVGNDRSQLASMAKQTKDTLEAESLDVVADRGYFNSAEILACEKAGMTVTLPKPMTSGAKSEGRFRKWTFATLPRRTSTSVLPVKGSPAISRTRNMGWSCIATGPMPARAASSSIAAPPARSVGSRVGSMSMFSRPFSAGSTSID